MMYVQKAVHVFILCGVINLSQKIRNFYRFMTEHCNNNNKKVHVRYDYKVKLIFYKIHAYVCL